MKWSDGPIFRKGKHMTISSVSLLKRVTGHFPGRRRNPDGRQSFWIYSLLLRKTLGGFSFVASKLPNVDLLLKLDDDLDIRSPLKYQQCFFSLSTSLNPRVNILGQ